MSDTIELARTSRSRCRECRKEIDEGEFRFGSDREGLYADGAEAWGWFHLKCASRRLPERLLATLKTVRKRDVEDYEDLVATCTTSLKKAQSQFPYGERAPTGRAKCVRCNDAIAKDSFRVAVEREIVTGAFTRMGAAYLHPACAVPEIGEAELGKLLIANSPMLSRAEAKELAAQCDAVAQSAPPTKKPKIEVPPPAPLADEGAELVLADALMDLGDARGELITLEAELAKMTPADARFATAMKRIEEITPQAQTAAGPKHSAKKFELERGFPTLEVKVNAKAALPDEPWLRSVCMTFDRVGWRADRDPTPEVERSLAALMQTPTFARVRHLTVKSLPMSWDGLRGFCSCDEIKNLQSLEFHVTVGPRGLLMLLGSTRFERLAQLSVSTNYGIDANVRGFDSVSGLHALRHLRATLGFAGEIAKRFVRSPLAQRLESLAIQAPAIADASLPNLRTLVIESVISPNAMTAIAKNKSLPIAFLDLRESFVDGDTLRALASPKALPSLRALAIQSNFEPRVLDALSKRFGAALFVKQVDKRIITRKGEKKR